MKNPYPFRGPEKKTFKKFFGNSVFTIKNEIKFQIYLKKAIKKIFFKNRRKFFFRNKQLSPSYFRIFKTSFQQLTIFLRYFFKVLTENLLSWITSLIRFENPNLNFLYFYIIKYFPSIYSKISEIAPPLFGSKFHFLIKKNLFWNYKDFIFRYDFKKNNNKSLTRENINFKKLNLLKDRSLFLKNLNTCPRPHNGCKNKLIFGANNDSPVYCPTNWVPRAVCVCVCCVCVHKYTYVYTYVYIQR